mmetsp:Transcript_61159/g.145717  ORF Transcript_61159/g.145717 Transcript_61159/m.145717 type:complete len:224 (+) Transcript_61159:438-1109(+)
MPMQVCSTFGMLVVLLHSTARHCGRWPALMLRSTMQVKVALEFSGDAAAKPWLQVCVQALPTGKSVQLSCKARLETRSMGHVRGSQLGNVPTNASSEPVRAQVQTSPEVPEVNLYPSAQKTEQVLPNGTSWQLLARDSVSRDASKEQTSGTQLGSKPMRVPMAWQVSCAELGTIPGAQLTVQFEPVVTPSQLESRVAGTVLVHCLGRHTGSIPSIWPAPIHWY